MFNLQPLRHISTLPDRWGNRPASLWIAEDFLGAALQADGETRSV